jgi:hypothetical protein
MTETDNTHTEDTEDGPTRQQIITALQNGDRDPISDADDVESVGGLQGVEAVHDASDGLVTLHYSYYTSYESDGGSYEDEFDIFDE